MDKNHNQYFTEIGAAIAEARRRRGEKSDTVAKAIGLTQGVISLIENGHYPGLKHTTLVDLCAYLEIQINDLPPR